MIDQTSNFINRTNQKGPISIVISKQIHNRTYKALNQINEKDLICHDSLSNNTYNHIKNAI